MEGLMLCDVTETIFTNALNCSFFTLLDRIGKTLGRELGKIIFNEKEVFFKRSYGSW